MEQPQPHLNFLAIVCSSIIPMIMGFIYYNPSVMGTKWMSANGFVKENLTPPKPVLYLLALLMSFLLSLFFWAWVTGGGGVEQSQVVAPDGHSYETFQHGLFHGFAFSLTVLTPIFITMKIFEMRKWSWAWVNILYWGLTSMVMCGILSAWR